jgi:hypothetical protein
VNIPRHSTVHLPTVLFNYEDGGQAAPGHYDFAKLCAAFADVDTGPDAPAVIGINEAKEWHLWGDAPALEAAEALSDTLHRDYDIRVLPSMGGRLPSAVLFDSSRLALRFWGQAQETVYPSRRGLTRFGVRGTSAEFQVHLDQWAYYDGATRLSTAKQVDNYGGDPVPTLLMGDYNGTASGPHLPQRDWKNAPRHKVHHKGIQGPGGAWGPDTRAMDHLLGEWLGVPGDAEPGILRAAGTRFEALPEIAHFDQGMTPERAFLPTVNNNIDSGGGLLIDWMLINEAWLSERLRS